MKNGGYFILDLKGKDRKSMEGVIERPLYNSIESNRKAVIVSGLVIDGKEYPDFFAKPYLDGTTFIIEVDENYDIAIDEIGTVYIRGDFNIGLVLNVGRDSDTIEDLDEKWANAKTISGSSNGGYMTYRKGKKVKIARGKYLVEGEAEEDGGMYTIPDIAQFVIQNNRYIYVGRLGRDSYTVN